MKGTPQARSLPDDIAGPSPCACQAGEVEFRWDPEKLRFAALALSGATLPAALIFAGAPSLLRWVCLVWLGGIAVLLHGLARRAACADPVVSIDARGILDRRLMHRRIAWQEIKGICPVDPVRGRVADIALRDPNGTLAGTPWRVRIGAGCQVGYGVPALTLSMLLLDGDVSALLDAIGRHRPDLLDARNRAAVRARARRAP